MSFDYSELFSSEDGVTGTWRELYCDSSPLSWNLLNILKCTILLPHDFYDLIAAYFLLPSALCSTIPYLFLHGQSGSGKSTVAKVASYLHGCAINSSSDTFAGIRNDLTKRRQTYVEVEYEREDGGLATYNKAVEANICMVWDDIDPSNFSNSPDLYRLFKFGSNKVSDKITISSKEIGQNLEFHCFCPKVFSSISPLHLDDRFKELKRRLIVIPCARVEELSEARKVELQITDSDWQSKILDLDAYDWKDFSSIYKDYWDINRAKDFIEARRGLTQTASGLTSQQRAISLDLIACGVASGVWENADLALQRVKDYWHWYKSQSEKSSELGNLLKTFVATEVKNAKNGGRPVEIYTAQLRSQVKTWVDAGWLYEQPPSKLVKETMLDLGLRNYQGKWVKEQ
ncbi:MAG: hypothetical protein HC764_26505 [Pleurocapsa sp. CRU_1_2]|nr:hypothetical protein [Pleurocapsa sp. CRU_1_2]